MTQQQPTNDQQLSPWVIETRHLYKRFGQVVALEDINLKIKRGEFVAIMGASGSGKTTLMNILTCLDTVSDGQVLLDGVDAAGLDEEGAEPSVPTRLAWYSNSST
ncbi:Macrolide export ATP-binding/permease protein MacB [Serratia fonticola]|uniref:Macrolide export ATP-binding/permease protein MacB n=1 Tax=Serratia fonticola TaxID=47917 RepID=A0A4U9V9W5_SERFO|nr:Macrolide export ATP-binding/permease protein MacB [Serratia fonticola]